MSHGIYLLFLREKLVNLEITPTVAVDMDVEWTSSESDVHIPTDSMLEKEPTDIVSSRSTKEITQFFSPPGPYYLISQRAL